MSIASVSRRSQDGRAEASTAFGRRGFLKAAVAGAVGPGLGRYARLVEAAEARRRAAGAAADRIIRPRARHLIVLFLTGGFSHVDTFDGKPRLNREHGKPVPSFGLRPDETRSRPLLGSPFRFPRAWPSRAC